MNTLGQDPAINKSLDQKIYLLERRLIQRRSLLADHFFVLDYMVKKKFASVANVLFISVFMYFFGYFTSRLAAISAAKHQSTSASKSMGLLAALSYLITSILKFFAFVFALSAHIMEALSTAKIIMHFYARIKRDPVLLVPSNVAQVAAAPIASAEKIKPWFLIGVVAANIIILLLFFMWQHEAGS